MSKGIGFQDYLKQYIEEKKYNDSNNSIDLKRKFILYRKNRISKPALDDITKKILHNYDELRDIKEINEILQLIIIEYNSIKEVNYDDPDMLDDLTKRINNINVNIFGNEGTKIGNIDYNDLLDIIKWKLNNSEELLINRDDILNILKEYSNSKNIEKIDIYNKLINDIVIPYTENEIENINNPKAIDVLKDLALIYLKQGEYKKCLETYDKCISLYDEIDDKDAIQAEIEKLVKDQGLLTEWVEKIKQILVPIVPEIPEEKKLTKMFLSLKNIKCMNDLVSGLNTILEDGFEEYKRSIVVDDNKSITIDNNEYMTVPEKVEGIQKALDKTDLTIRKISRFNDAKNTQSPIIEELQSTVNDYENYVLIDLKEIDVSLLECLTVDSKSLQIIPNELLFEILEFERVRDQNLNGSLRKYHVENFGENLIDEIKIIKKLRAENKPIDFYRNNFKYVDDEIIPEDKPVQPKPDEEWANTQEQEEKQEQEAVDIIVNEQIKEQEQKKIDIKTATMQELLNEANRLKNLIKEKREELERTTTNKKLVRLELQELMKQQDEIIKEITRKIGGNVK